jgi:hypothetical protein
MATPGQVRCVVTAVVFLGFERCVDYTLKIRRAGFLKAVGPKWSERLVEQSKQVAQQNGRPWDYYPGDIDKDGWAKEQLARSPVVAGLIGVGCVMQACPTFKLAPAKDRPGFVSRKVSRRVLERSPAAASQRRDGPPAETLAGAWLGGQSAAQPPLARHGSGSARDGGYAAHVSPLPDASGVSTTDFDSRDFSASCGEVQRKDTNPCLVTRK